MPPRILDLTGKRVGMLTALFRLPEKENRYYLWECSCDCGGRVKVSSRQLQRGVCTNCGCKPKNNACNGSIAEDITGQRFGKLTAVERIESKRGKTRWLCKCDCGGEFIGFTSMLKSGASWHCGCITSGISKTRRLDLAGRRFGRLLAIKATEKRNQKGSVIWECICDCGTTVEVACEFLIGGNNTSCGCRRLEINESLTERLTFVDGTCVEWIRSRKHRSDNTSGYRGVYKTRSGKWRVSIGFKGQNYHIGTFEKFESAKSARQEAEKKIHEDFILAWEKWNSIANNNHEWALNNPFIFDVFRDNGKLCVYAPILENA